MDWLDFAKTFGVPVVGLIALAWCVGRALTWIGTEIVLPLVKRAITFMDGLAVKLEEDATDRKLNNERAERAELRAEEASKIQASVAHGLEQVVDRMAKMESLIFKTKSVVIMQEDGHGHGDKGKTHGRETDSGGG